MEYFFGDLWSYYVAFILVCLCFYISIKLEAVKNKDLLDHLQIGLTYTISIASIVYLTVG